MCVWFGVVPCPGNRTFCCFILGVDRGVDLWGEFCIFVGPAGRRSSPETLLKVAKCAFGQKGAGIALLHLRGERFASSRNPLGRFPDENASRASRRPKDASQDPCSGRDRVSRAPRGAAAARSDDGTLLQWELDDAEAAGRAPRLRRVYHCAPRRPHLAAARSARSTSRGITSTSSPALLEH